MHSSLDQKVRKSRVTGPAFGGNEGCDDIDPNGRVVPVRSGSVHLRTVTEPTVA
jgi:hypothetical protein